MKRNTLFFTFQILCVGLLGSALVFSQAADQLKGVRLRVSVTDKNGQIVDDLKEENFTNKESKVEQEISYFSAEDEPASVAILLDISGSIKPAARQLAAQSVLNFARASNNRNDYALTAFGEQVYPLTDWGSSDEENVRALKKIADEKPKFQETNLWDSYLYALDKLDRSKYQKKILLIFSDGLHNVSDNKFKKVRERLKASDVSVYSVALIHGKDYNFITRLQGQAFLDELSSVSGGKSFYPLNQKELVDVTLLIALLVRRQYVIGYMPKENPKKDNWRAVSVNVEGQTDKGKKVSFNTVIREGYISDKPPK